MTKQDANNSDIRVSVGVLQSQMDDIKKQTDRIESKIDNWVSVKPQEFEQFKQEVSKALDSKVDKDEIKPLKNLFWGIISAIILGLITVGYTVLGNHIK